MKDVSVYGVDTHARAATLRQWFVKSQKLRPVQIPILRNVNFEARHGDRIGIIGTNGSGKSSLLKVISGNYPIHEGEREVEGTVAPLIEMGAGFDPEVSGRRNIKLSFAYRGKLRDYSPELEEQIIAFSELGDRIELPLKTYSSGMSARLAFASVIFQDPDILLLDEIFATGDTGFIKKSREILKDKVNKVSIALMVNHGVEEIMGLCNRFVLMDKGRIIADGAPDEVLKMYDDKVLHLPEGYREAAHG